MFGYVREYLVDVLMGVGGGGWGGGLRAYKDNGEQS